MELVEERIADGKVLRLVEGFLKAGVLEEGVVYDTSTGTPQGGIVSPLLANIYLNPLDWLLAGLGLESVRYADDLVVMARDAETAESALATIREWMEGAGLTLHPEKTRVVNMGEAGACFDFLGYRFKRTGKGRVMRLVRPKSKQSLRAGLRPLLRRCNGRSMEELAKLTSRRLRGWYGYFKHADKSELRAIDGWVRMRLRSIQRKRAKKRGRGRGTDHRRWSNRYFAEIGLFSLEHARYEELMSLHHGANC